MHHQTISAIKALYAHDADAFTIAEALQNVQVKYTRETYNPLIKPRTAKHNHPIPLVAFIAYQARKHTLQDFIDRHNEKVNS